MWSLDFIRKNSLAILKLIFWKTNVQCGTWGGFYFSDPFEGNSYESCFLWVLVCHTSRGTLHLQCVYIISMWVRSYSFSNGNYIRIVRSLFLFILYSCTWKKKWTEEHEKVEKELKKLSVLEDWRGIKERLVKKGLDSHEPCAFSRICYCDYFW